MATLQGAKQKQFGYFSCVLFFFYVIFAIVSLGRCEININECENTTLCENGGRCEDLDPGYRCDCAGTGFVGKNCSVAVRFNLFFLDTLQIDLPVCFCNSVCLFISQI